MKKTILLLVLFVVSASAQTRGPANRACDRACLAQFMTRYLDALVVHKPGDLPLSDKVRFTEDTIEMKVGEGLWKTASKLTGYRQDILDVRQGVAGAHVVVEENGTPVMLAVRLKVEDQRITEIETMVVRNQSEGQIFDVAAVKTPNPAINVTPERSQLNTREEATRIAVLYPEGLKTGSFVTVDVPFATGAYRFENGRMMAGPNCTFAAGCNNIKTQRIPRLAGIKHRVAAVDEEQGIVWLRMDFGPGSLFGANAGKSLVVFEAFKVYGGQIHAVEAFMEAAPQGASSGWDK